MIIYKTTNLISGRIYIGKASGKSITNGYLGSGLELTPDIIKYGSENFRRIIIDIPENRQDQNCKEIFWIAFYREKLGLAGLYNISDGGDGGDLWSTNPNKHATSKKLSENNKRRWNAMSIERRKIIGRKISKGKIGKSIGQPPRTTKHTENNRRANTGISRNKGADNPMYGKTKENNEAKRLSEIKHSETAKKLGFWVGDKNPSRMKGGK